MLTSFPLPITNEEGKTGIFCRRQQPLVHPNGDPANGKKKEKEREGKKTPSMHEKAPHGF